MVDGDDFTAPGSRCRHAVFVHKELGVPVAQLIDRTITFSQHRFVDPDLVLPDHHVLIESIAITQHIILGQRPALLFAPARDLFHHATKTQLETVGVDRDVAVEQDQ